MVSIRLLVAHLGLHRERYGFSFVDLRGKNPDLLLFEITVSLLFGQVMSICLLVVRCLLLKLLDPFL